MTWTARGTPFSASDTTSSLALSLSSTRAPTAGDLMQIAFGIRNSDTATVSSVVDDQGGSWTRLVRYATAGQFVEIWSGVAAASANTVITITFSGAVQSNGVAQAIGSSVGSWFKQDEATGSTSAGTTHTPGTVDAISGDLLLTMTTVSTAFVVGALATDYSQVGSMTRAICQRRIAAGTITVDGAWTTTDPENTVSAHVVLREGTGSLSATSTAAASSWVVPPSTASVPGSATSTAAVASWVVPASVATPGAVATSSVAAIARWVAREGTSAAGPVDTASTPAVASWVAPASTATPGAAAATSTPATASWVVPPSVANVTGSATSIAAVASWVAVPSQASAGPVGATSVAVSATWTVPASVAAVGPVATASVAAAASWVVPASTASTSGANASSVAAVASWVVPASQASPGPRATASTAAASAWVVPPSYASDGTTFENVPAWRLSVADRIRDAVVGSTMERRIEKGPSEVKRVGVNWAKVLRINGASIVTSSWAASPAGTTQSGSQFTGDRATVLVAGGTVGADYVLVNTITTTDGQTLNSALNGADLVVQVR